MWIVSTFVTRGRRSPQRIVATKRQTTELIQGIAIRNYLKKRTSNPGESVSARICAIVPAFNEEKNIGKIIDGLRQLKLDLRIYVIDDGSSDRTEENAKKAGAIVLKHPMNLGQWAALRTGFMVSVIEGMSIAVSVDADGQHDPRDLPKLVEPILNGDAELVVGSRFRSNPNSEMQKHRYFGIMLLNNLVRLLTKKRFTDCTCGYKAYDLAMVQKVLLDLKENQYGALEFLMRTIKQNAKILEKPIKAQGNRISKKGTLAYGYNLIRTVIINYIQTRGRNPVEVYERKVLAD